MFSLGDILCIDFEKYIMTFVCTIAVSKRGFTALEIPYSPTIHPSLPHPELLNFLL